MNEPLPTGRDAIVEKLRQTQPWLRFMGILTMLAAVLMGLGGAGAALIGGLALAGVITVPAVNAILLPMGLLYLALAFVYLFPALYLLRGAAAIRRVSAGEEAALIEALEGQRRFWKFVGITAIVFLILYALAIFAAIAIPAIAAVQKAAQHAS